MATAALRLTGNIAFNRGNGTVVQMEQVGFPAHVITSGRLDSARLPADPQIFGNLTPVANLTYDLGSAEYRWKDLWLSGAVTGNGALLTSLDANQLDRGIVPAARFGANVAIGEFAGLTAQGNAAVAIGFQAGANVQAEKAVAIGYLAGFNTQGASATAVGQRAGETTQDVNATAIGSAAGQTNQGNQATAVGRLAGSSNQDVNATAIGSAAGQTNQGINAVAVGRLAGASNQGVNATALGTAAGSNAQSSGATAVGLNAGMVVQGLRATAVGMNAGISNQGSQATAIGDSAGSNLQGNIAVAVGVNAGRSNQGIEAVAVGPNAGHYGQGAASVAIGSCAGVSNQGEFSTAVGYFAGESNQQDNATALGYTAGRINQGNFATALGGFAGCNAQGNLAVAIGWVAGRSAQGSHAIAIGYAAGNANQASNSIVINASGTTVNNTTANSCVIKPVRDVASVSRRVALYDSTSGEISTNSANFVVDASNRVGFPLGTAALPSIYFGTDTNTGIYSPAADALNLTTGGTVALSIDSVGTIDIATNINLGFNGSAYTAGEYFGRAYAGGATHHTYFCGRNVADTSPVFYALVNNAAKFYVEADGSVHAVTTTIAAISDENLKRDISDAHSQWEDMKAITWRRFRYKSQVEELGADNAKYHLGIIAQEIQPICPNVIETKYVRDDNGKETDVFSHYEANYAALWMKSAACLKEAMLRIEALEAENAALKTQMASFETRLTALESSSASA